MGVRMYLLKPLHFNGVMSPEHCLDHFLSGSLKKLSPHNLFIIFSSGILNLVQYILAKSFRVKAQPWRPDPKPTVPFWGSTCNQRKNKQHVLIYTFEVYFLYLL